MSLLVFFYLFKGRGRISVIGVVIDCPFGAVPSYM